LLPTLIDLCGLATPNDAPFDGVSLAKLLKGGSQPELASRMLVTQYGGLVQTHPQKWDSTVMWNQWRLVKGEQLYDIKADPGQEEDIAGANPDIVAKMRAHYEQWWGRIEPTLSDFVPIGIGSDRENPACLTSLDWLAPTLVIAAQPFDVRLLGKTQVIEGSLPLGRPSPVLNSPWYVQVEENGRYEISLRRWPIEADAEITAALPEYKGVDGTFPAGMAVPAVKARLKVGDADVTQDVAPGDKAVTFEVELKAGKMNLQTWFHDDDGKELCGAFYVYVQKK
jgi:arylsulfatase